MMHSEIQNDALNKLELEEHDSVSFMPYSTCNATDFLHPNYKKICLGIIQNPFFHRKQWEFVYIIYQLYKNKVLFPSSKGLGFGVGSEPLSSFFASLGCSIFATDAPQEIAYQQGWSRDQQYSENLNKVYIPEILSKKRFDQQVVYKTCDMNHIDPQLSGFDFCWSSCCFEHLGSLEAGLDFVINSVEKTLRLGGIACHTTEYNLSSNDKTLDKGLTVIYRKQDMEKLVQRLRKRGHLVSDLLIAPNTHPLDAHVDIPPYRQEVHIKLKLAEYTCTSIGIFVQRRV